MASISVALLVAGLVRFLVVIFLEMPFLAVVQVMRMVTLSFAHTLLVSFVLRVIGALALVLKKWGGHGLDRASRETDTRRYRENAGTVF
jgi:hypothetical protein